MAQWWDEWQLRIVVLASLCAQYFIVLLAGVRKYHIPPWLRASFRLAHIGSDALALFVLAMLFNRQKGGPSCSYARGSRDLELLWAPIVLMHLGGQVVITTYKIEDNEQWSRHILISLSKITIALYVFYKSWSSDDKRLLATTILLFILVIIRCFQKVRNLKRSSFNALRKASSSMVSRVKSANVTEEEEQLDKFILETREIVKNDVGSKGKITGFFSFIQDFRTPTLPDELLLDLPCPYSDRLEILSKFWSLDRESGYRAIEAALSDMTSYLYTKDDATGRHLLDYKIVRATVMYRTCSHVVSYGNETLITAICLVHASAHTQAHRGEDTWVTLVLLYGTLLLEVVYVFVQSAFMDRFSGRIRQRSLIGLLIHNRRYSRLRRIMGWLGCKDLFNDYFWHMEPRYSCEEITKSVCWYVKTWWTSIRYRHDYRMLNDTRGDGTLTRNGLKELGWSIRRPFDESIILWHLATELCHRECKSPDSQSSISFSMGRLQNTGDGPGDARSQCKQISNYMMHLLFDNPEMLMAGSRKSSCTVAYDELEEILKSDKTQQDEMGLTWEVIQKCKAGSIPDSFVRDAWLLVQSLLDHFNDEIRMWEAIQGVWVEMLCFSACRCRGYLHAEALGTGVEYLSYVWVLMAFSGMQTFPEKLGRSFDSSESDGLIQRIDRPQWRDQPQDINEYYGLEQTDVSSESLPRSGVISFGSDESYRLVRRIRRTNSI